MLFKGKRIVTQLTKGAKICNCCNIEVFINRIIKINYYRLLHTVTRVVADIIV